MGASVLLQLILLLPLALGLGLAALWYRNLFLSGAALLAFVLLAWIAQPRTVLRVRELRRDEAPALYAHVDALADQLDAPRIHTIALDDDMNAGALELHRGVSLRRTRRVLVLGRPLLGLLDVAALEAVIAHELGHFSRQHGRLGHWLYRTHTAWAGLLEHSDAANSSPWDRSATAFARRFLPWFSRISRAHRRRCEFEADALAAQLSSPPALARALLMLDRAVWCQARSAAGQELRLMREHAAPPRDLLQRQLDLLRAVASAAPPSEDDDDEQGSHPPTALRLAALGVSAAGLNIDWPDASAGVVLLGERWPQLAAELAVIEDSAAHLHWQLGHRLLQGLASIASDDRALRLRLASALADDDEARQLGESLLAQNPGDAETQLLLARCLLALGEDRLALPLLQACRAQTLAWRDAATATLVEQGERLGLTPEERRANERRLVLVRQRRQDLAQRMATSLERGEFAEAPLDEGRRQALAEALSHHPALREAWLVGLSAVAGNGVPYQGVALLLRIDPQALAELGLDDDQITAQLLGLLALVLTPELLRITRPSYTTEGLPPVLEQRLLTLPTARLR